MASRLSQIGALKGYAYIYLYTENLSLPNKFLYHVLQLCVRLDLM